MNHDEIPETSSSLPSFRLHSPAVDFIENRLPAYHPAFDPRHVRYDSLQARFVAQVPPHLNELGRQGDFSSLVPSEAQTPPQRLPRSPPGVVHEMAFWEEIFPKAMSLLNNDATPDRIKDSEWKIRKLPSWADVQAKLDMARQKYDFHCGPKHIGKFRRWMRNGLDKHAVTLAQGTRVIPEMDIVKPVVGSIRLVVDAYRQVSQTREELETSFEDLPEVFEKISFYVLTFPNDTNIVTASSNLVCSILIAIERAITFYTSHQATRAGSAILSGPQYVEALLGSLRDIERDCKTLESQASMSFKHRVTNDNNKMMQQNSAIIDENIRIQQVLGAMNQHVQMSSLGTMYLVNLFNQVLPLLSDLQRPSFPRAPITRSPSPSPSPQPTEAHAFWYPQDIRSRLQIPNLDIEDLQHVAEQTEFMIHEDRGRTQQLLETRPFRNWMRRGSTKLLVHGNFRPPYDISPLSVVCTLLTHTFRTSEQRFIGLVFFCGRHLKWDEFQGSLVMIRSLIAQLLHQFSFLPIRPDPMLSLHDLERNDVNTLCHVFTMLIRQLPSSISVFCVVDGVCLYETEDFEDGLDVVIMHLVNMAEQDESSGWPALKLLITSPQPTLEIRKVFDADPDTIVYMQNLPASSGGVNMASAQERMMSDFYAPE